MLLYRVILVSNGVYKSTLHRGITKSTVFNRYHLLIEENKKILFPKRFINTKKILPVKFQICVSKPTEPDDVFRTLRDDYGRLYTEKPLGDWTILASNDYEVEEDFWIYGHDCKANRPTIAEVLKKLFIGAYKKNMVKQVLVVHNKLVIYNEDQFDMVICKCIEDSQRLHHTLFKLAKKQKIKSLIFMGTATPATIVQMYGIIKDNTGWTIEKIKRTTTRP